MKLYWKIVEKIKTRSFIYSIKEKLFMKYVQKYRSDEKLYLSKIYKHTFGIYPNLDEPKTYNEKLLWQKLHWRNDLCYDLVDKYKVRKYVEKCGLEKYLVKLYGVYNSIEEIDLNILPSSFVIKTTHDSGGVVVINNKTNFDKKIKKIKKSINAGTYNALCEWPYEKSNPKIIIEERIIPENGKSINDYKFFCFDGKPQYLFVATNRDKVCTFDFFDMNWNWINVKNFHPHANPKPKKPKNFNEMINIASTLSQNFPQVRVDLYSENGHVYFGELTFFHFGGNMKFSPNSFDEVLGDSVKLNKTNKKDDTNYYI
jgi:hypothetical protein